MFGLRRLFFAVIMLSAAEPCSPAGDCHALQADADGGEIMQHGRGGRLQDAQSTQRDEAELKVSTKR